MVKNGFCHSGHRALELAVSQELINEINRYYVWWKKSKKTKSYVNNFWVSVVKDGCDLWGHGTLKFYSVWRLNW